VTGLLTLPNVMAGIIVVALNAYVLLAGADFGGGIWDLLASGPRRERQRALIARAMGPVWEANHVWLIFVVVILFTCFPPAFAAIATELHIPITLMLIGIVLRGSAFVFRTYDSQRDEVQHRWGLVFSISSLLTPALLGAIIGALASGDAGSAATLTAPSFGQRFVAPWTSPFALAVGAMALSLFAFLAAVYLTVEAEGEPGLQDDFRRRALGAAVAVFVCALGTLLLSGAHAPQMMHTLTRSALALPLQLATGLAALAAIFALVGRRFRLARIAAAAQLSLILWGWAAASYPWIVPPTLSIETAASSARTLRLTLVAVLCGFAVLIPSLAYLLRIFKSRPAAFERLDHAPADSDV
jgi:cytochrome bd ubiquinol oxidase subunit II